LIGDTPRQVVSHILGSKSILKVIKLNLNYCLLEFLRDRNLIFSNIFKEFSRCSFSEVQLGKAVIDFQ